MRLLTPIAKLYGFLSGRRRQLFNNNKRQRATFTVATLVVGNLQAGGTGKTPHAEWLIQQLLTHTNYKIGMLSRGYRRRTSGFILADSNSTAWQIGDEPMQVYSKFADKNLVVAVGEARAIAIPLMLAEHPDLDLIILDDAFQHMQVLADEYWLLTPYYKLYTNDEMLPLGGLREPIQAADAAQTIIVSKCPTNISVADKANIIEQLEIKPHQKVYFSYIRYGELYNIWNMADTISLQKNMAVLLVCGIAKTNHIENYVGEQCHTLQTKYYTDHHYFTDSEIKDIIQQFNNLPSQNKYIVTTEKDAMRFALHRQVLQQSAVPIYVLPINTFFNEQAQKEILNKVEQLIVNKQLEEYEE